ncbi:MAG: ATP-binding protein [Acidobacteriota bacterium]
MTIGMSLKPVPLRALLVALMAMTVAVTAAVFWPEELLDRQGLAAGLALIPALLLAHYRGWAVPSLLLGAALAVLCISSVLFLGLGVVLRGSLLVPIVLTPYVAIALGAGWAGEIRRSQAELRATQLQLIQSEKLDSLGRMAAGVAHEVKNPLMMILTGVKILSKRLANADESTRLLLQDMTDAVERADRIIGGLLSYSRNQALERAPLDLGAAIERSLLLVKHQLDTGRIAVVKDLDSAMPALTLDGFKIQQVFVNLLTNAIQAIGHDGEIRIRACVEALPRGKNVGYRTTDAYRPGERVAVVRIEDTGPGIPDERLAKVFDPFFTTKPPGSGTGLGLSVSRQIVEMHGGTIEIGNRDAGGARVTIRFKLEQKTEPQHDQEAKDSARRRRGQHHAGAGVVP